MRLRHTILIIYALLAVGTFVYPHVSSSTAAQRKRAQPQGRSTRERAAKAPASGRASAPDYTKFSHQTSRHQLECKACHEIPTSGSIKLRGYPDVADYPDHDSCIRCHRQEFFKGARPIICAVCHTRVSPRDETRFAFRKPDMARQFKTVFPHDKHQDVIALNPVLPKVAEPRWMTASLTFNSSHARFRQEKNQYNNCSICHETDARDPRMRRGGWPDSFIPAAQTFKTMPRNHASCFDCHWKSQEPTSENCAGCHQLTPSYVPQDWHTRISLKFTHATEPHIRECATCHINITKSSTRDGLKTDVPITTCAECHNKEGRRTDVADELGQLDKDRSFNCAYCHTSDKGRLDAPASHYLLEGRQPLLRKDIK